MALSVSGFPEPSRHTGAASSIEAVSAADDGQEGSVRSTVMNSPRLRGLFGGSGNAVSSGRKAASPGEGKPTTTSSTSSKADENDGSQLASSSPSPTALTFAPSFEPVSQQKYEFDSPPSMYDSTKAQSTSKRIQPLPPLPRKAKASPVRLGPSLTRLDIGAVGWSRLPMAAHIPSKPPPPSVVIEEWPQKDALSPSSSISQARPLPTLPPVKTESSNSSTHSSVAGSSRRATVQQSNAVAGPSQYPGALVNSTTMTASSSAPASPTVTPPSKVLIMQPIPRRTTKHSLTMRYQPLVAASSTTTPTSSSTDSTFSSAPSASPIRPLPRVPPTITPLLNSNNSGLPALPPLSTESSGAKIQRPKTSPGIITGFTMGPRGPVSANTPTLSRSPFTTITTSWPSRNSELANNPLPIGSPLKASRARSHSRLSRRDRSLDSYYSAFSTPRTSPPNSRVPSPIGGRPAVPRPRSRSVRHAATIDQLPRSRGSPTIPSAPFSGTMALQIHIADAVTVGKRRQPPSPPVGPVKARSKPAASGSPPISRILNAQPSSHSQPSGKTSLATTAPITAATTATTTHSPSTTPPTTAPYADDTDDMYSVEAPLHSHPIDSFTDTDSMANPPLTPISLVEVYIDDQDYSMMSRSPSPIRYARPDSRGNLSSTDDDDDGVPSSSSSESGDDVSLGPARRRTQLRSYRNSYRPRAGASPPHIPYRRSPSPMSEQQQQQLAVPVVVPDVESKEKAKKKKATRSYFSEYITTSAPTTRASSPERKSRSRQPRMLANAVSLALRNTSPSPKRPNSNIKVKAQAQVVDDGEVLDIGPIPPDSVDNRSSISETLPQASSARSSAKVGWVKTMARKRSEVFQAAAAALGPNSVSHLSNAGTAPVEVDGAETPYMWISTSKPPVAPAPFIPAPPPPRHRRVDSAEQPFPNTSERQREREREIEKEIERYNLACGIPLPTASSSKLRMSDPSSSNVQSHTASSSISIPSTSFSGFGIASRTRKISKHVSSPSVPFQLHHGQSIPQAFEETLDITHQSNHDATDDNA